MLLYYTQIAFLPTYYMSQMVQYHVTYDKWFQYLNATHIFSAPISTIMVTTYNLLFLIVILNCIAFVWSFVILILQWIYPMTKFLVSKILYLFLNV
jgi:hypothetical protein